MSSRRARVPGQASKRIAVLFAAVVAFGVAAAVWALLFREGAKPVSVGAAVRQFRDEGGAGPGVYTYATDGFEEVDALLGQRHDYPAETAIVVRRGGCGLLAQWEPLEGRTFSWQLCPADAGLVRAEIVEVHTFFGNRDKQRYVCNPAGRWWSPDLEPGQTWTSRCAWRDRTETAEVAVEGDAVVDVDGESVEAVHLHEDVRLRGVTEGTGTRDWWLDRASGLVLRLRVRNDSVTETVIGGVGYHERFDLRLLSLEPRR